METSRAEEAVQAVLHPDPDARERLQRERLAAERSIAERRKVAWLCLAGALVGLGVACLAGYRPTSGLLWGGLTASLIGWLFILRGRLRAGR